MMHLVTKDKSYPELKGVVGIGRLERMGFPEDIEIMVTRRGSEPEWLLYVLGDLNTRYCCTRLEARP